MVRLLKVKELEERKKFLLARSEMYRKTLTLEVANIKFSTALLRRKLKSPKAILALLGSLAVPTAGYLVGRRHAKAQSKSGPAGLLPKVMVGWKLFNRFAPWIMKLRPAKKRDPAKRQNLTQFP